MSSKSLLTEEADSTASSFRLPERGSFRRVVPMDCNSAGVSQVGQAGVAAGPATAAAAKPAPAGNMTFRKLLTCLGLISAAQPASGLYTQGVQITMTVPPYGVSGGVTGQVTGLPGGPGLYKGILLLNGQCNIWWDKSHNAYRFTPDPATAQDAGLVLDEEGRFHLDAGQYETSPYDILAHHMAVFILPKGVPLGWPQYVLENW